MNRRMKKNAIRTSISPARPVSVQRSNGSRARARDDRSRTERPPRTVVRLPASIARQAGLGGRDRLPVALQAIDLRLRLRLDRPRQRRVLQLRGDLLARTEPVVQPVLDELRRVR